MDLLSTSTEKMYFRVVVPEKTTSFVLDSRMLLLLVALDENKNIAKISEETGIPGSALSQSLRKLVEMGLAEPMFKEGEREAKYVGAEFLKALTAGLAKSVGPMGAMLVSEALADLKIPEEKIPLAQAAEIINVLAFEIPKDRAKYRFQKEMLNVLRKS